MDNSEKFKRVLLTPPHCTLGKNGITDEFLTHVTKLLKRYKMIKIKALKSVANKLNIKALATEISTNTNSYILDIRGRTIIISKAPIGTD